MESLKIDDTKVFMSTLLKGNLFDFFEVRSLNIQSLISYDIDCKLNKDFLEEDQAKEFEELERNYCLWGDVKNFAFEIIKGKKTPKLMKIILSFPPHMNQQIHEDASALFLNITYDGQGINCVSGCSRKNFAMDKTLDILWDEYVLSFFINNNITYTISE